VNEIYVVLYLGMALSLGAILLGFIRRSEFGLVVAYAESFTFFGAFVYPVFFYSELITPALEGASFLSTTGTPTLATAAHIGCYLVGALSGFALANQATRLPSISRAYVFAGTLIRDERAFFRGALIIGICSLGTYLTLIGPDNAIAYAAAMRSGIFDNIGEDDQRFLFLKSLSFVFTFIVCFIPSILKAPKAKLLVFCYLIFVAMLFLVSISRTVILLNLVIPLLIYLRIRTRTFPKFLLLAACTVPFLFGFLLYGKPLGFVLFKFITDGEIASIEPYLSDHGFLSAFFGNFEFIWFSTEAGIRHFLASELPLLPPDLFLSPAGFVPSRVFGSIGLESLDYRAVQQPLACLNTSYFGFDCSIPPRDLGLAAYVLPFTGAFVLGFAKYFIFRRQEKYFIHFANANYARTWYPLLVTILATMVFSFIPTVLSQFAFLIAMLLALYLAVRLLRLSTMPANR
jgi:hypothetical protein